MALELLSGRILAPWFGNSIYVWGGVITTFMLALSIGYLLGGRASMRAPTLRRLAFMLVGAAVAAIPVVLWSERVLEWVFGLVNDPRYGSLLSVVVLFFVPTALSGMVGPYAVRLLVKDPQLSGHFAGLLYFVSTFGSAAGTILTSFYLVLYLEVDHILLSLIGVSMVLGSVAMTMGNKADASSR